MKRTSIIAASLFATVAFAGTAGAANENAGDHARDLAAKECTAAKKADRAAFNALYGPKHAMRQCIKRETPEAAEELKNASKECKAERAADPDGFEATYGSQGKCVSQKVKAEIREDVAEFKNAAKECKAEREADPEGFRTNYGSNENGKNALGKCVSEKVRADEEPEETA